LLRMPSGCSLKQKLNDEFCARSAVAGVGDSGQPGSTIPATGVPSGRIRRMTNKGEDRRLSLR
jgi:hypothetical protein